MLPLSTGPGPVPLMMDDPIDSWSELSSPSSSLSMNIPGSFLAGISGPHEKSLSFEFGPLVDSMNTSHGERSSEAITAPVAKVSEDDYCLYRSGETPFSQGVSYNDSMHKFDSVLAMCEFDSTSTNSLKADSV